jgi:hypothetical protein
MKPSEHTNLRDFYFAGESYFLKVTLFIDFQNVND